MVNRWKGFRLLAVTLAVLIPFTALSGFSADNGSAKQDPGGNQPSSVVVNSVLRGYPRAGTASPNTTPADICNTSISVHKVSSSEFTVSSAVTLCSQELAIVGFTIHGQHCPLSIGSTCILPWSDQGALHSCNYNDVFQARCPSAGSFTYGGASSGQLWRGLVDICATFIDDSFGCTIDDDQVQF
jgi:hypothetical protein